MTTEDRLLSLYAAAIDSGIKEYADRYNKLLTSALKEAIASKNDAIFRNIGLQTEYETQYNAMVKIREEFFDYNKEETDSLIAAMS